MTQTRRLAAILAADVAGYSRLIGADAGGTLQALKAIRAELIDHWLKQVVTGHFVYYAVPTNSRALSAFRH